MGIVTVFFGQELESLKKVLLLDGMMAKGLQIMMLNH